MLMLMTLSVPSRLCSAGEGGEMGFEIKAFEISGNSLFTQEELKDAVAPFTGRKTATDVEKARDALEKLYHDAGYPAVMVNIPEQTIKDGVVRLQVIESRIGRVKITGNRYFTMAKIMSDLPSLSPGKILYLPDVQAEISRLNRNQDFKVDPVMTPGKEVGTIDVELKVEDKLPLHGYLELNNRASHDTTELRLNAMLRYDNLWQKEHSFSLQYQMTPLKSNEVEVIGASYVLPAPWEKDHQLAFYGIYSDSNTAFGEGFRTIGRGEMVGLRYVIPLPQYLLYSHNITIGLDYKHFDQAEGFETGVQSAPVYYVPLSFSYSASLPDEWGGVTQFSAGLNMSFRHLGSWTEDKRFNARANYFYATAGVQRTQKLPWGMGLFVKIDGQIADQPLIDNEQYSAGGMESVRGYRESEALGDNALHGTVEVSFPDPLTKQEVGKWFQMTPFLFYDAAKLRVKDALPGQESNIFLDGTGAGMRGSIAKYLEYEVDWAVTLNATAQTKRYGQKGYFKIRAVF